MNYRFTATGEKGAQCTAYCAVPQIVCGFTPLPAIDKLAVSFGPPISTMIRTPKNADGPYWLLAVYMFGWIAARMISDANLDPAGNMLENYAWGQYVTWGTSKHPPLMAWVAAAWFEVMPNNDGFYHVLAYLVSAIGLLGVYCLARALNLAPFALTAVLLLSIALPYSTLAAKFNANTVLLAVWPWVAWAWISVLRRPTIILSALLGLLAALAMLGKYYSGVLLLAIGLATLIDPDGRRWLLSRYALVTIFVGALCLAPHVVWLVDHQFPTLSYLEGKGGDGVDMKGLIRFAVAPFVFWLLPWLLVCWWFVEGDTFLGRVKSWVYNLIIAWKPTGQNKVVVLLVVMPWLVSVVLGAVGFVDLRSHWAIPIGFGYPLLWLINLTENKTVAVRLYEQKAKRTFFVWLGLVLVFSPIYAWQQGKSGSNNYYLPREEVAQQLVSLWQEHAPDRTLSWTAGHWTESTVVSFYVDDAVTPIEWMPGEYPANLYDTGSWRDKSGMLLCPKQGSQAAFCIERANNWVRNQGFDANVIEIQVKRSGFRFPNEKKFSYLVYFYLP